ncbi:MAG: hypothetical protein M3406_11730 [Chloroflexota bacterium]|nr:hypothetical protein [Chloroflexota bacterium]
MLVRLLGLLLLSAAVQGCAEQPAPLPTQPANALTGEALLENATLKHDRGCFWLEAGGERYDAVWPPGFSSITDPPRIVDQGMDVVAEVGKVYDIGGGLGSAQASSDFCSGPDRDWWIGEIAPDQ